MPRKDGLLTIRECDRIVLRILNTYEFLRPPKIERKDRRWTMRGMLTTGELLEHTIERRLTAERTQPVLSTCDPSRVPERIVPNYENDIRGNFKTIRRDS